MNRSRALALAALLAFPLVAQTPTPTPPPAPTRYKLATQIEPGFPSTVPGDTYYALDSRTFGRVAGNTTTTRKFWCQVGTGAVSAAPSWCGPSDFPTLNQNTTGSAAKWTTARLLAGASVDGSANVAFPNKFIVQGTTDAGLTGAQFLGALGTGVLKNTTTTGVLSIAALADIPTPLTTKGDLPCWTTLLTRKAIGTTDYVLTADPTDACGFAWKAGGAGSGTVTSVGNGTVGPLFSASWATATTTPALSLDLAAQAAHCVIAGPASGSSAVPTCRSLVAADLPTFVGSTPGAVPDASGAGAGTYLDKAGNWTTPAGAVTSPLTTKGDLWTYSTGDTRLAVGANGTVPMADSTATPGLSYQWPGVGTLRVLKETVFAGITPTSYSNGSTYTVDGSGYTVTVAGNGAVDMVATGLRLRQGTTSSTNTQIFQLTAGNTGDFNSFVGEERMRRGKPWAFWIRIASYDYTNTASATVFGIIDVWTGKYGARFGRIRNALGAPNTTTGGLAYDFWWNAGVGNLSSYSSIGVSSADVLCIVFRTPLLLEAYVGTYSSGWPTLSAMTKVGSMMPAGASTFITNASGDMGSTNMSVRFLLGTSAASSGTYEIIFDRWRLTAWE